MDFEFEHILLNLIPLPYFGLHLCQTLHHLLNIIDNLYIYDNGYTVYSYIDGFGWFDPVFENAGSVVINRGQGLWVKNTESNPIDILLSGDIPGNEFQFTTKNLQGIMMVSSAYPSTSSLSSLRLNPADGDAIYVYDNRYTAYSYIDGLGWIDEGAKDD